MAGVSLEGVTKRYRDAVAVRDLDLEIVDGEMLVLVGPSGCGKTTLLRIIAGLEMPDAGIVRFDGQDMAGVTPAERNIAMVFEDYALFPHMAVRDNLAFALRLRKTPSEEVDHRVADVAEAMELEDLLGRRPKGLATGERQHVAVGRVVVRDTPSVLLLDDALAHLDARQRLEARSEVARLHRDLGSTVVSVTHDQAEALAVGTRVAVMDEGRLMQVGPPQELYERPANAFVAGFIGNPPMNLLEATCERRQGRSWLRFGSAELEMPERYDTGGRAAIDVGIRPQDISLLAPQDETSLKLSGRCELVEYLGSQSLVHLRIGEQELVMIDDPADDLARGDLVDGYATPDHIHLFDSNSGLALPQRTAGAVGRGAYQ